MRFNSDSCERFWALFPERSKSVSHRDGPKADFANSRMKKILSMPAIFVCPAFGSLFLPDRASGQHRPAAPRTQPAPVTTVTVDGSEAMFTTMCALLASGFEADVSAEKWSPMRAQLRERMQTP